MNGTSIVNKDQKGINELKNTWIGIQSKFKKGYSDLWKSYVKKWNW